MKLTSSAARVPRHLIIAAAALAGLGLYPIVLARSAPKERACCHSAPAGEAPRSDVTARYDVPDVTMVRSDGARVPLRGEIDDGRPVVLSFVFTTCTTVCPVLSRTMAEVQRRLRADREDVHLISISIDPEEDTPPRLAAYAQKVGAGPEWTFYTGTVEGSTATQRAFDAYRGDKMHHTPTIFVRAAPGEPWARIEGFASADRVVDEVRRLVAAHRGHVSP